MRGHHGRIVGWGLVALFGIAFASIQPAHAAPGEEIKLPPLRVQVGEKAPDFALPAAGGTTIHLTDFREHNVLIDFYRGYW